MAGVRYSGHYSMIHMDLAVVERSAVRKYGEDIDGCIVAVGMANGHRTRAYKSKLLE